MLVQTVRDSVFVCEILDTGQNELTCSHSLLLELMISQGERAEIYIDIKHDSAPGRRRFDEFRGALISVCEMVHVAIDLKLSEAQQFCSKFRVRFEACINIDIWKKTLISRTISICCAAAFSSAVSFSWLLVVCQVIVLDKDLAG